MATGLPTLEYHWSVCSNQVKSPFPLSLYPFIHILKGIAIGVAKEAQYSNLGHQNSRRNCLKIVLNQPLLPSDHFCEILALNYAPGAGAPGTAAPGAWIIWSNNLSKYAPGAYLNAQCSRSISKMHNAQGGLSKYAPRAVYIQIMLLEHIELTILPQIIHAPGAAVPGAAASGA